MVTQEKEKKLQDRPTEDVWIPTVCEACNRGPCVVRVRRTNGVLVNIEANQEGPGFEELSKNQGRICPKAFAAIQKLYNPHRIKTPLKRRNPEKGPGVDPKWVEITWDEALDTIAEKLKKIRTEDSRKLCQGGPVTRPTIRGTWQTFIDAFGPTERFGGGGAVRCGYFDHVFGNIIHAAYVCEPDLTYCNYLLVLGRNQMASGGAPGVYQYADALARGMKMVVIDPVFTITAAKAHEWIPIKPGTDTAFLLALIHVIIHELKTWDGEFLKTMTNSPYLVGPDGYFIREESGHKALIWDSAEGRAKTYDDSTIQEASLEGSYMVNGVGAKPVFQVLKDHVKQYTPEWAHGITEIEASTIRRIAREWVEHAKIGSSIQIEGVALPYRPVATRTGRGISGVMRQYQARLAEHILAVLVGALETVGAHKGGTIFGASRAKSDLSIGIVPGQDGMLRVGAIDQYGRYQRKDSLIPYVGSLTGHLPYLNMVAPLENFPFPPPPEVYINYRCNPVLSIGDKNVMIGAIKKVPFVVSIAYVHSEVTELADIVLPEHNDLERYELHTWPGDGDKSAGKKFLGKMLRQPVVEPLYNTMDISDIFTELAERVGFLDEYNEAVNNALDLGEPYRLDPNKKYPWEEIVDRHCRSATGGDHDLSWFKEHGNIFERAGVEVQYGVHLTLKKQGLRYPIPYMEHVKKTGEELAKKLQNYGVDWWDVSEYVPLPTYFPPILDGVPAEYDLYATNAASMQSNWGQTVGVPWLIETAQHIQGQVEVTMNADAAQARGIQDGDEVWVESQVGRFKQKVKLMQGIRPDTIAVRQFGYWATPVDKDTGWGSLGAITPIKPSWTDPLTGAMQGTVIKVKVYKA